jgi:2-alkenal reductase
MTLYRQSMPSVVSIEASFTHPSVDGAPAHPMLLPQGSGFLYDDQGHIVTNAHVVANADLFAVRFSESTVISATVIGRDTEHDIALLALDRVPPVAPLMLSERIPEPGMWIMAIGNPYGLRESLTVGIISAVDRTVPADSGTLTDMIQVDAAINPGSSGGVLIDRTGAVIGMSTAIQSMSGSFEGIGYAIPAAVIRSVAATLHRAAMAEPITP